MAKTFSFDEAQAAEPTTFSFEDAIKEVDQENKASTLIGSVLRGHKGRKTHSITKEYPEVINKRL